MPKREKGKRPSTLPPPLPSSFSGGEAYKEKEERGKKKKKAFF